NVEAPMAAGFSQQLGRRLRQPAGANLAWQVVECLETLHVLVEGVIRSPGAILSQHFEKCLQDMRTQYDVILVDGPPMGSDAECRAFVEIIDAAVVCSARDKPELPAFARTLLRGKRLVATHPCG